MHLVLIPGVQGRWQWMAPTVDALARHFTVITFSLCPDPRRAVEQIDEELDRAGVERAVICGVSLGGMIGLHYAARRPERVSALVLASTPGPRWTLDRVQAFCAKYGAVTAPVFVAAAIVRMFPEVARARGGWLRSLPFIAPHLWRVATHPASPRRMRQRVRWWLAIDRGADARQVTAPTLVVTGERDLDRVVPVDGSREYGALIAGAQVEVIGKTGHIGTITRAEEFAELVARFVANAAHQGTGGNARSAAR
jgi:pimeloyl-ACP methyl ester carboxylesterase